MKSYQRIGLCALVGITLLLGLGTTGLATEANEASAVVYFTKDITPQGLQAVYDALEWSPTGKLAVKVSTGEPPSSNYLRQELIGSLVTSLNGTYVECNTELMLYESATQYLKPVMNGCTTVPRKTWKAEAASLAADKETLYIEYAQLKEEVRDAEVVRRCVEQVMRRNVRTSRIEKDLSME